MSRQSPDCVDCAAEAGDCFRCRESELDKQIQEGIDVIVKNSEGLSKYNDK